MGKHTTNAALRQQQLLFRVAGLEGHMKPTLSDSGNFLSVDCAYCGGPTDPEEVELRGPMPRDENEEAPLFHNRMDVLVRCRDCKKSHWVIAMPAKADVDLEFFVRIT